MSASCPTEGIFNKPRTNKQTKKKKKKEFTEQGKSLNFGLYMQSCLYNRTVRSTGIWTTGSLKVPDACRSKRKVALSVSQNGTFQEQLCRGTHHEDQFSIFNQEVKEVYYQWGLRESRREIHVK